MTDVAVDTPLASFETKWAAAHPEFELGLKFVAEREWRAQSAFACLVFELEHAAFAIREAEPATIKLQWWAEEFARAGKGGARHPLTQALAAHRGFATIPPARWYEAISGALAQRDPAPAADRAALLEGYAALYRPLAAIEAALFPAVEAAAATCVRSLVHALRETAALGDALRDGRLLLPLDLLAKHRLARGDLARASPQQVAMLREWLLALSFDFSAAAGAHMRVGALHAAAASADRWRARMAARAVDPLATLNASFARLPLRATWAAWRAGRHSQQ
jgi:phytoene synthase